MKKDKILQKTISMLVQASFKDGKIVESRVGQVIKILKSLPKYEAIQALSAYLKAFKREERKYTMYVESAIPLSFRKLQKMKQIVERKTKITKVVTRVNPDILGGFKLRVGDEVWDETILGKINQIKEAIVSGRSN